MTHGNRPEEAQQPWTLHDHPNDYGEDQDEEVDADGMPKRKRISIVRWTISLIIAVPLLILWILFMKGLLVSSVVISASMSPTLEVGDRVLVWAGKPPPDLRGQIIAFRAPPEGSERVPTGTGAIDSQGGVRYANEELLTKRVIATDGDLVKIKGGEAYLNYDTTPLPGHDPSSQHDGKKWTVGTDEMFVIGDNRDNSKDSREYGPVSRSYYVGRVVMRLWPWARAGRIE